MPAPPRNLRRWQLAAGLAAAAGIGVGATWLLSPPRAVLTTIDPPAEGTVLSGSQPVRLRFNLPILPEKIEQPAPLAARFEPAIAGAWRWIDRSTAEFTPSQPWPLATPIAVTVPADPVRTADGFRLATDLCYRMRGELFAVRSATVTGFTADGATRVRIAANQPMSPARLAAGLSASGWQTSAVTSAESAAIDLDLRPPSNGSPRGSLTLALPVGFAGAAGPIGLETAWSATIAAGHRLVPTAVAAASPAHGDPTVHLVCAGTFADPQVIAKQIWIDPPVPFQAVQEGGGLALRGPFVPGTAYQISVAAAWPADHPEAKLDDLPAAAALTVAVPHRDSGLWIAIRGGALAARAHRWPGATVQLQDAAGATVAQLVVGEPGDCEPAEHGLSRSWPVPLTEWIAGRSPGDYRLVLTAGGDRAEAVLPVREVATTPVALFEALATIPSASPWSDRTGRLRTWALTDK